MIQLLIFVLLFLILFAMICSFCKSKSCAQVIDSFRDFGHGCKNIPSNFEHGYESLPNQYGIAPIPAPPLGANGTMVWGNQGGCASNINGVNKIAGPESPLRHINHNASYCVEGSDNDFNIGHVA